MWDEWDEDPDDYYNARHQRRLSDPSANLNNFSRYGWKSKSSTNETSSVGAKARSENEGLDSLASEVSEIEGGDLRDGKLITLFFFCLPWLPLLNIDSLSISISTNLYHLSPIACFTKFNIIFS